MYEIRVLFSVVESFFDVSDLGVAECFKGSDLRKILAQKTGGIFVRSTFPSAIGMSKVDISP